MKPDLLAEFYSPGKQVSIGIASILRLLMRQIPHSGYFLNYFRLSDFPKAKANV